MPRVRKHLEKRFGNVADEDLASLGQEKAHQLLQEARQAREKIDALEQNLRPKVEG